MTERENDLRIRPGRIRDGGARGSKAKNFVGQVLKAAQKSGHMGTKLSRATGSASRQSTFGRGRFVAFARSLRDPDRRVVVKARVVRHRGARYRSAPLSAHVAYLKRDGVTRDAERASMFDASTDVADESSFAARCEEDRHHFRFIVSPEDAPDMGDLRAFTRELVADMERDLGSRLDWIAVDHWNTDNPHLHLLVRGKTEDGSDLVISRDYISRGLRVRAEELVTLELGPRSEHQIRSSLEREVGAERWTKLDLALQREGEANAGIVDLRPGAPADKDPELRRLMVGRAQRLERLGLSKTIAPGRWTIAGEAEATLRDLSLHGDIIKTIHRAMVEQGIDRAVADYAIHGEPAAPSIIGRLVARGLHDELAGSAHVIIDGVDGRAHHLRLPDLAAAGDTPVGGIVELRRSPADSDGKSLLQMLGRSDFSIDEQVSAQGATWHDRQCVAREPTPLASGGFGAEVKAALDRRADHLVGEGLARRQGQRAMFARDLLETLRRRELDGAAAKLGAESGLPYTPIVAGEHVVGVYRRRVSLTSGRFAMIDNGLGFSLVPWRPSLERSLGKQMSGVMQPGGGIEWSFARKRGPALG